MSSNSIFFKQIVLDLTLFIFIFYYFFNKRKNIRLDYKYG